MLVSALLRCLDRYVTGLSDWTDNIPGGSVIVQTDAGLAHVKDLRVDVHPRTGERVVVIDARSV